MIARDENGRLRRVSKPVTPTSRKNNHPRVSRILRMHNARQPKQTGSLNYIDANAAAVTDADIISVASPSVTCWGVRR